MVSIGITRTRRVVGVVTSAVVSTLLGLPATGLFGPAEAPAAAQMPHRAQWLAEPLSPPDPTSATPSTVAGFFARVPAGSAEDLTDRYPDIVGRLDGAPVRLRYRANHILAPGFAGRQILLYDRAGDGRIAEVIGDLGTADRIVVLVPGVDNVLANFDTGHGGRLRRAPSWQAHQLYDQIRTRKPSAHVAVIPWLGYDPPEGVRRDALREDRAVAGAAALDRFVDGLVTARPGATITVIGHSYGSTVAGLAAAGLSAHVHDLVAIGSPGMGGASTVADLHSHAQVWAGSAPNDWTRRIPGVQLFGVGHGRLPWEPDFGALALPTGGVDGHDGYFVDGSSALRAMAGIALSEAGDAR
ncbi:alpha/beta hydrolase [Krasilnikovia sp. MM14-A1259]|uniref:alpha/beta hydrolase n=1 Tax=Krasilnikovia sp. MM14-A1259 TaxID=3373539 RepID=UPI00381B1B76